MAHRKSTTKVAVFSTHPVQYHVPWLQGLARSAGIEFKMYYGLIPDAEQQAGAFGVPFVWDIPLLEGYSWEALPSPRRRPTLQSFYGNSTPEIYGRLSKDRPEVLILTGWNALPLLQAWFAAFRLGIPMLMRCEANAMRHRPTWVRAIHRTYLRTFRGFLAIGESNRRFYEQNGIKTERIWEAPYFVDNARIRSAYEKDRPNREELRRRWGIAQDAFCFLYVGKLEQKKRILDLLEALRIARGEGEKRMHVLVVGSGELDERARAKTDEHKLPVSFAGFLNQTQLSEAYAVGDCLVLPSDFGETWGLVVNEAMVCGLPAIVSDRVGCGPDLVVPGETGQTFQFGNVSALAEWMRAMSSDPARASAMGDRARKRVTPFRVEAAVEGTRNAIDAVVAGQG